MDEFGNCRNRPDLLAPNALEIGVALLERNPEYWRKGQPFFERVMLRTVPDPAARATNFRSGETDVWGGAPPTVPPYPQVWLTLAETKTTPVGRALVTETLEAVAGPRLVTVRL